MEKRLFWSGASRSELKAFPANARQVAGYQLWLVQQGEEPDDWKPLSIVGTGVKEIRVRTGREHRVNYVAKFEEIYVLHAFEKKTQKTPRRDLELAKTRLAEEPRRDDAKVQPGMGHSRLQNSGRRSGGQIETVWAGGNSRGCRGWQ